MSGPVAENNAAQGEPDDVAMPGVLAPGGVVRVICRQSCRC
jgi:hypothetical protein